MALHAVCKEEEIEVGTMKSFKVEGDKILLFHLDDGFYATQHRCTHVLLPLDKGKVVDGCQVQCPYHRARFDIKTGEVVDWANFPPGIQMLNLIRSEKSLRTYPVTTKKGTVYIEIEE